MTGSAGEEFVVLARVARPRGNRGEVAAQDLSGRLDHFEAGTRVFLLHPAKAREEKRIERAWPHQGRLILKFEGVDSINEAETLRGCEVAIPAAELGPPPAGEYYYRDLVGCKVVDADDGHEIGTVMAIQETGGPFLLETRGKGREVLIPFRKEVCVEVDTPARRIAVRLPEGLEDLND